MELEPPMSFSKINYLLVGICLFITACASSNSNSVSDHMSVCTMDARICPDGSSVGRVGPNCEFEACPEYFGLE